MADHGMAFLYAVALWWFSTGAIVLLCRLKGRAFAIMLGAAIGAAGFAFGGIAETASLATPAGAYLAFSFALVLWGFIELTFLTGLITGPRTAPCPPGAAGWARFRYAAETLLYHELAIALTAASLIAITWGAPNQAGTFTFLALLVMRVSAKLNIFLGVPNLTDELMPARLAYLKTYFRKAEGNALFPVAMVLAGALAALLAWRALSAEAGGFDATAFTLLFTLVLLAIVEHAFMMLPVRDGALWRWAMPATVPPERRP